MDQSTIAGQFQAAMYIVMLVALPPLLVAMATGLIIAILQSATQIQDQTLPLTVKLITVGLVLATMGPSLTRPLVDYTNRIFEEFPAIAR
jgi:type III secretion protein S